MRMENKHSVSKKKTIRDYDDKPQSFTIQFNAMELVWLDAGDQT